MRLIKKLIFLFLAGVGALTIWGCESTNAVRSAYFSNITVAGSNQNTIQVTFQPDDRVNSKYVDIQVKSSKPKSMTINEENVEPVSINFTNMEWNSLETLIVEGNSEPATETFGKYKDISSKTYIITCDEEITLTFRVVVGEPEDNSAGTGKILTNSKEISNEFELKLKALKTSL